MFSDLPARLVQSYRAVDFDSEFRHADGALATLQGLDRDGRTIHVRRQPRAPPSTPR
jgi:hypothetical protein